MICFTIINNNNMERVISLTESIEFSKIKELSRNSIKVRSRYRIPWERVSLEQRFSFRSFGGRGKEEEEKRKKGDTGRFRFAAKRFCEFELNFLQATTLPPLPSLSAIIVAHRIHVAPFFPSPPYPSFYRNNDTAKTNS